MISFGIIFEAQNWDTKIPGIHPINCQNHFTIVKISIFRELAEDFLNYNPDAEEVTMSAETNLEVSRKVQGLFTVFSTRGHTVYALWYTFPKKILTRFMSLHVTVRANYIKITVKHKLSHQRSKTVTWEKWTWIFQSGFLDSLVYVMLPSLFSFFALFWAFYALHSYTADQKNMAKVWSRVDRTRQSIRSGFNKSGKSRLYRYYPWNNRFSVESTRKWMIGQRSGATPNGNVVNDNRKNTKKDVDFFVASSSEATPFSRLECTSPQEDAELICKSDATPFSTP